MEIVRIFGSLCSFKFEEQDADEYVRTFDDWNDTEFLFNFFVENENDLKDPYWGGVTIEEAVQETLDDARELEKKLIELCEAYKRGDGLGLDELFKDLNNGVLFELKPVKAYGKNSKRKSSWLRLYAIRMGENSYIISGGAIKLTHKMKDNDYTKLELKKFEQCLDYLKSIGVWDKEGLLDIE